MKLKETILLDAACWREEGRLPSFGAAIKLFIIRPEFRAVALFRLASSLQRTSFPVLPSIITRTNAFWHGVNISPYAEIGARFKIVHLGAITIGGRVRIGHGVEIRQVTTLGGRSGRSRSGDIAWTQPRIGNFVILGCHVAVLGPVLIGDRVTVAAGAVVIDDARQDAIVGGVPARMLS